MMAQARSVARMNARAYKIRISPTSRLAKMLVFRHSGQNRMMIRIRRHHVMWQGMFLELLHGNSHGLFKLRIVAFANQLGILPHLDVRRDAVTFDFPLAS